MQTQIDTSSLFDQPAGFPSRFGWNPEQHRQSLTRSRTRSTSSEGLERLRIKLDGTALQGNHRIKALEERGYDTMKLGFKSVDPRAGMIHWIENRGPGKLGVMARPRGGDWLQDDIAKLKRDGIHLVVSLLEDHENTELDLLEEGVHCANLHIDYISHPIPDRGVPDTVNEFLELVERIDQWLGFGRPVVIHCRAGIGRSSMIAAGVLCRQGVSPDDAFGMIERARGLKVPDTPEQRDWVRRVYRVLHMANLCSTTW